MTTRTRTVTACAHCKNPRSIEARGLCKRCYAMPEVRPRYGSGPGGHRRPAPVLRMCRHCGCRKVNKARGLCWTCYSTPGVLDRYPPHPKYGRRGVGILSAGFAPAPEAPTAAAPGTPEKLEVMERRVKEKRAVHHEADARHEGDPLPWEWLRERGAAS